MAAPAWQAFQDGDPQESLPDTVRPQIRGSWARSRARGVDPEHLDIRHVTVDTDSAFVRAGSRVLLGMADVLLGTRTSLALTDPQGHLLWRWEDDRELGRLLDRSEIGVGSAMGERDAGTNGIAVALAERRLAAVVADEHYKAAWHGWTCAAAPVIHPVLGRTAGVVNITCRAQDANHLLLVVLRSFVDAVGGALAEAASTRERRLMDAHVHHCALTSGPVVTLDAHHMIVNDDAAGLGLDRPTLWDMVCDAWPRSGPFHVGGGYLAVSHVLVEGRPEEGCVLLLHRASDASDAPDTPPLAERRLTPLEVAERRVIVQALHSHRHNKSDVAAYLGISRGTLYERLRRYGLS
ncbi:MAG TPA: helix-turn-helix domain-containing protein [Solirubrobacteraceae bacterium]|nr:helix-turn-helix domain-containing protein [Solirubrobacteraceae bacterium]